LSSSLVHYLLGALLFILCLSKGLSLFQTIGLVFIYSVKSSCSKAKVLRAEM